MIKDIFTKTSYWNNFLPFEKIILSVLKGSYAILKVQNNSLLSVRYTTLVGFKQFKFFIQLS